MIAAPLREFVASGSSLTFRIMSVLVWRISRRDDRNRHRHLEWTATG
jgi:hypothetical protein